MNPAAIRLLNQQLAAPLFSRPEEVVGHMGAVQAQEYRLMRWAVGMRTRRPSAKAFRQAYDAGRIVRLHLHRGTWQLVSGEDYWWMMDLCSEKCWATITGWMRANRIELPEDERRRVRSVLERVAGDMGSAAKEDFAEALRRQGIVMDDHRASYHIRLAETDGVLCSGDLHPSKATYALSEVKIGPRVRMDRDEELALMTRKYFQSHSPATLEDYVWWSGLNIGDCRRGMELLGQELVRERWKGREFFILASCRTRGFRSGRTLLIPSYDEYLIGYKSRDISLPAEHRHRAHNNSGIFYPVVARDGIICGNWKPFAKTPEPQWFGDTGPAADPSWSDGSSNLPVPQRSTGTINSTVPQRSTGVINSTVPQRSAGAPDISAEWEAYQAFLLR